MSRIDRDTIWEASYVTVLCEMLSRRRGDEELGVLVHPKAYSRSSLYMFFLYLIVKGSIDCLDKQQSG